MTRKTTPWLVCLCLLMMWGCRQGETPGINLEQKEHPLASRILYPGMGTIGLVKDGKVHIFFLNEDYVWEADEQSSFRIPGRSNGLLAVGNGTLGVLRGRQMQFYRLSDNNEWKVQESLRLRFPRKQQSVTAVKMPWEMGQVAFAWDGFLEFFYPDANKGWTHDETASFAIPPGIDAYLSLGNMTVAVVDDHKLGVYYLDPEYGWIFLQDHILQLPETSEAIMTYEPGVISVLSGDKLEFYALDARKGSWVMDEEMRFDIPEAFL